MTTNPLIAFIQEIFKRLVARSPTFFKVWKVILGIPVLIIALPNALEVLNIHLPQVFNDHITTIVSWASTAAFLMTFLPAQDEAVAVDQKGTLVKQTDSIKLPFTALQEAKFVDKGGDPKNPVLAPTVIPNPVEPPPKTK